MALTGQLSDLSLAELIEFFCNLKKTGRLKVDYAVSPGVFYFQEGELVDAQIGNKIGAEAIFYALSLPNASFDFNTHIYASRRSIHEPWMQLILEGLRRLDEGISPDHEVPKSDRPQTYSGAPDEPSIADVVAGMDDLHRLEDGTWTITSTAGSQERVDVLSKPPPPLTVGAAAGGRRRIVIAGVVAACLICGTAVVALTDWFGRDRAPAAAETGAARVMPSPAPSPAGSIVGPGESAAEAATSPAAQKAGAPQTKSPAGAGPAKAAVKEATGSRTVMVQVMVDENGRVSQASVANSRPGMESYEASALRIARQRRYPAGKAGPVTVPVKIN